MAETLLEKAQRLGIKPVATSTGESLVDKAQRLGIKPAVAPTSMATFPAVAGENPLIAGAKSVGNLPSSVWNMGKGIVEAVRNPITTARGVGDILGGAGSKVLENTVGRGVSAVTGQPIQPADNQAFDAFTSMLKDRYGSLENLQKTATEDPFGFGADLMGVLEGGASLVGKTAQLNKAVGVVGRTATKPVTLTASKIGEGIKSTAKFGTGQYTGLNADTISMLLERPEAFKNVNPELRVETATKVAGALDERLGELSDLGKGYESVRQAPIPVNVSPTYLDNMIKGQGVKIENGRLSATTAGKIRDTRDISALQNLYNLWKPSFDGGQITSNELLNFREDLSKLSRFGRDIGKSDTLESWARQTRSDLNNRYGTQVEGLRDLDAQYAPERELLGQLKKDIFDAKGELKDSAISKIANLTGKGKEQVLERVKQVVPDIEDRVRLIKAVEDIERASGFFKTGTYIRGALTGGAVLTGNVPAIIGAIIAQPSIAVPLLKGAGYVGQKASPILEAIKNIANDVNNFTIPASFKNKEGQLKMGMSIEDVSKNIDERLKPLVDNDGMVTVYRASKQHPKDVYKKDTFFATQKKNAEYYGASWYKGNPADLKVKEIKIPANLLKRGGSSDAWQLIEDIPVSGLAKQGDNLLSEARKYKSAEEFVKAQGTYYHGTSENIVGKLGENKRMLWLAEDPAIANKYISSGEYGAKGDVYYVKPTSKLNIKDIYVKNAEKWDFEQIDSEFRRNLEKQGYDGIRINDAVRFEKPSTEGGTYYDRSYHPSVGLLKSGIEKTQSLTKSQLTDIWKKANGK